jgi:hypothetical protein
MKKIEVGDNLVEILCMLAWLAFMAIGCWAATK